MIDEDAKDEYDNAYLRITVDSYYEEPIIKGALVVWSQSSILYNQQMLDQMAR
jgi:hypothetical protein